MDFGVGVLTQILLLMCNPKFTLKGKSKVVTVLN
jgi:hypothetical protein